MVDRVIQRMAQEELVGGSPGMTGFCASGIGGLGAGLFAAAACAPTTTDSCDTAYMMFLARAVASWRLSRLESGRFQGLR
jgi:hypothetical protein